MPGFALNHMTVRALGHGQVLKIARDLGCVGVEFRNDLAGPLFGGDVPSSVRAQAREMGLRILALAEVKAFNDWSDDKRAEADRLIATAAACGAEAVALIPRNDGLGMGNGERQAHLRVAIRELAPMLEPHGLIGLIEPLGFDICALRHKSEAVDAIVALGLTDRFKLVHDTFHHHLAGGGPIFAAHTAIVHISGVVDPALSTAEMRDEHRLLVDARDRLGNLDQIEALLDAGYDGPISMEAFAPEVHALDDPATDLAASYEFIRSRLVAPVA